MIQTEPVRYDGNWQNFQIVRQINPKHKCTIPGCPYEQCKKPPRVSRRAEAAPQLKWTGYCGTHWYHRKTKRDLQIEHDIKYGFVDKRRVK